MRLRKNAIVRIRPLKDCTVSLLFLSILLCYVTLRGNEGAATLRVIVGAAWFGRERERASEIEELLSHKEVDRK